MPFFKRKSQKADSKQDKGALAPEITKPAYKHIPTHAASDSVGQGGRIDCDFERTQIAIASRQRRESSMYDSALGNASYAQSIAQEMAHGSPSPSGPYFDSLQGSPAEPVCFADDDGSLGPAASTYGTRRITGRLRMSRNNSDYFTQQGIQSQVFERSGGPITNANGKGKEAASATPGGYSDSGYESGGASSVTGSRTSSVQNYKTGARQIIFRNSSGFFLPELSLGESFRGRMPRMETTQPRSVPDHAAEQQRRQESDPESGDVSPVEVDTDTRSIKSSRSSRSCVSAISITKRTRFEDVPEPMPPLDQLQSHLKDPSTIPTRKMMRLAEVTTALPQIVSERPKLPSLGTLTSTVREGRSSQAPLTVLEGYKVNKKGRILDEEGDLIGELVQGDLLDCVRQKANAKGEVLDEHGSVVGLVVTISGSPKSSSPYDSPTTNHHYPVGKRQRNAAQPCRPELAFQSKSSPDLVQPRMDLLPPVPRVTWSVDDEASVLGLHTSSQQPVSQSAEPETHWQVNENKGLTRYDELKSSEVDDALYTGQTDTRDSESPEPSRRHTRSANERTLSDMSKHFARPSMTSVPEDNVPDSGGKFAYKGKIPSDDRPQQEARMRSRSPAVSVKTMVGSSQRQRMQARRATTHFSGGYPVMHQAPMTRASTFHPPRRSPLSGPELSPKESEVGRASPSDENQRPGHGRTLSMASATSSKPRTYFSHGGKVTVDPNAPTPKATTGAAVAEAPQVIEKADEQKKSRLSLRFGKKSKK